MATTKLSASAKPFTFNPAAKSFVFQPAAPPPPPPRLKRTYTTDELFELQQPLYSGSSLVFSPDLDCSAILLYDPCFDYVGAGLIAAVPIQPADGSTATEEGGWQQQSKRTPPKKTKKAAVRASNLQSSPTQFIAADAASTLDPPLVETTAETGIVAVVVEGVRQASADRSDNEDDEEDEEESEGSDDEEEDEDGEDDDDEEESGEEDEEDDAEEEEGHGQHYLRQPMQQQQYVWVAQPYAMTGGGGVADDFAMQQQQQQSDYYNYYNNPATPAAASSFYPHEDTSDRRRQYMSHFSQQQQQGQHSHYSSHAAHSSYHNASAAASAASHSGHRYPSSKHHHNSHGHHNSHNNHNHGNSAPFNDSRTYTLPPPIAGSYNRFMPRHVYDRATLLDLRLHESCQERPQNLPHFLTQDIYKTQSSTSAASAASGSRSLFGNTQATGGAASRSVFGAGALQANTNHSQRVMDSDGEVDASEQNGGLPPKRGGKIKSKRKKNKDRSARAIDDDLLSVHDAATAAAVAAAARTKISRGGAGGTTGNRGRLDSVDHDDEERKEDQHGTAAAKSMRGLSTPKHKPLKQKQGKKGKKGGGGDASPRKRGGGGGGGPTGSFQLDSHEFDNATMADLHHCANKWQPSIAQPLSLSASSASGTDSLLHAEKTARSILNKLSIDKLGSLLSTMVNSIQVDTPEVLQVIVDILFDKSVDEPEFAGLYAKFCAMLSPHMPEFTIQIGAAAGSGAGEGGAGGKAKPTSKTFSFRTMLLTRCYTMLVEDEESLKQSLLATATANARAKEFSLDGGSSESLNSPPTRRLSTVGAAASIRTGSPPRGSAAAAGGNSGSPRSLSPRILSASTSPLIGASATPLELPLVTSLELAEKLQVLQVHQRGNLIFIGELFKQNMLAHSVVHLCLDMLLDKSSNEEGDIVDDEPSEWDVECVCIFLANVGKKLDDASKGLDVEGDAAVPDDAGDGGAALRATRLQLLDGHFRKVAALSRCAGLPSRFRFMLQDLLELRARGWVPRIQKTVDPKSLTEIREHAAATLATPQHAGAGGSKSYMGAMTSVKKGAHGGAGTNSKSYFAANNAGAHAYQPHQQQQHLRTSVRPTAAGGFGQRHAAAAAAAPIQGRTLQFGSPVMQRSISAPDSHASSGSGLPFSPLPPLPSAIGGGPAPSPGAYVPAWKRRALGMDEHSHALLPRSAADSPGLPEPEQGAAGGIANPSFDNEEADAASAAAADEVESAPSLSEDAMLHQLNVLLDELYSSHDLSEALQCLSELEAQVGQQGLEDMQRHLVSIALAKCVEQRLDAARELCPGLLHALSVESGDGRSVLGCASLVRGLSEFLSVVLPDVAIDIPHAPKHAHAVLASLLHEHRLHPKQLWNIYKEQVDQDGEGAVSGEQAVEWSIDVLVQLRALCADEETMVQLLARPAPSDSPLLGFAAALFGGDSAAAAGALAFHDLSFLAPIILAD